MFLSNEGAHRMLIPKSASSIAQAAVRRIHEQAGHVGLYRLSAEVAKQLRLTISAVKTRLHRARVATRERIRDHALAA